MENWVKKTYKQKLNFVKKKDSMKGNLMMM